MGLTDTFKKIKDGESYNQATGRSSAPVLNNNTVQRSVNQNGQRINSIGGLTNAFSQIRSGNATAGSLNFRRTGADARNADIANRTHAFLTQSNADYAKGNWNTAKWYNQYNSLMKELDEYGDTMDPGTRNGLRAALAQTKSRMMPERLEIQGYNGKNIVTDRSLLNPQKVTADNTPDITNALQRQYGIKALSTAPTDQKMQNDQAINEIAYYLSKGAPMDQYSQRELNAIKNLSQNKLDSRYQTVLQSNGLNDKQIQEYNSLGTTNEKRKYLQDLSYPNLTDDKIESLVNNDWANNLYKDPFTGLKYGILIDTQASQNVYAPDQIRQTPDKPTLHTFMDDDEIAEFNKLVNDNQRRQYLEDLGIHPDLVTEVLETLPELRAADKATTVSPYSDRDLTGAISNIDKELDNRDFLSRYASTYLNEDFNENSQYAKENGYNVTYPTYKSTSDNYRNKLSEQDMEQIFVASMNGNQSAYDFLHYREGKNGERLPYSNEFDRYGNDYEKYMTDDEVSMFNYLYNTQGSEAAMEYYIELSDRYLKGRASEAINQEYEDWAKEDPFMANLATTLTKPFVAVGSTVTQLYDLVTTGHINADDPKYAYAGGVNTVRSTTGDMIRDVLGGEGTFGADAVGLLYDAGMSAIDNVYGMALGGSITKALGMTGKAADRLNEAITLGIMSTDAAQNSTLENLRNGMSEADAIVNGFASGFIEFMTEKIGMDNFFNSLWRGKGAWSSFAKQVLAEGGEEVLGNISEDIWGFIYDQATGRDVSSWRREMNAYILENGLAPADEAEAFNAVFMDHLIETGKAGLMGSISAVGLSGYGVAQNISGRAGTIGYAADYGDFDTMLRLGMESDPGSRSYKTAQEIFAGMTGYDPYLKVTDVDRQNLATALYNDGLIDENGISPKMTEEEFYGDAVTAMQQAVTGRNARGLVDEIIEQTIRENPEVDPSTIKNGIDTFVRTGQGLEAISELVPRETQMELNSLGATIAGANGSDVIAQTPTQGISEESQRILGTPLSQTAQLESVGIAAMPALNNAVDQAARYYEDADRTAMATALRAFKPNGVITTDYLREMGQVYNAAVLGQQTPITPHLNPAMIRGAQLAAEADTQRLHPDAQNEEQESPEKQGEGSSTQNAQTQRQATQEARVEAEADKYTPVEKTEEQVENDYEAVIDYVSEVAEKNASGFAEVVSDNYSDDMDTKAYLQGTDAIYQAASEGKGIDEISNVPYINNEMKSVLYQAAQEDIQGGSDYVAERTVRVSGVSNGDAVQSTGIQSGSVAESAGREAQGRSVTERPSEVQGGNGYRTTGESATARSLGLSNGNSTKSVQLAELEDTRENRELQKQASSRGLNVTYFAGDYLEVNGTQNRGAIVGDRVYVRVDDPKYTPTQILKHEVMHSDLRNKTVQKVAQVFNILRQTYGNNFVNNQLIPWYLSEYYPGQETYTAAEIDAVKEEILCDIYGELNPFVDTMKNVDAIASWYNDLFLKSGSRIVYNTVRSLNRASEAMTEVKNNGPPKASRVLDFVRRVLNGTAGRNEFVKVSDSISENLANDIYQATGINVSGWDTELDGDAVRHINNRHGVNGKADHSMADISEYKYIADIDNTYSNVELLPKASRKYKNSDGTKAKQISITIPKGSGNYFVIEAVPDTASETLHIVSIYQTKNAVSQVPRANNGLGHNVQNELAPTASKNNLPQSQVSGNQKFSMVTDSDSKYMEMAKDPEANEEELREIVRQAAAESGYTIRAYHGTSRADRVGNIFLPERATSGPMAYFTSDPEVASNYAKDKSDTSLAYDDDYSDYFSQFRVKGENGKTIPVGDLWDTLPFAERRRLKEAGKHIVWDEDMENIIWDDSAEIGLGNWQDWMLREYKGNAIKGLIESWLQSGELYGNESDFLKVLDLAGIKGVEYFDPDARDEKVYDTYLKIQNPFRTTEMYTDQFVGGLEEWWSEQNWEEYARDTANADNWDKNNTTVDDWIEKARYDLENGNSHAFTQIPDGVTDYLKSLGYDGIFDTGGKNGGVSHTVYIPFSSEQVKSADLVVYDNNGDIIPLSQRFNENEVDIRYSRKTSSDTQIEKTMQQVARELRARVRELTQENKQLARDYEYTKAQSELTAYTPESDAWRQNRSIISEKDAKAVAKSLIDLYSSTISPDEITADIQYWTTYLHTRGEKGLNYVNRGLLPVAKKLVENAQEIVSDDGSEILKDIKRTIKISPRIAADIQDFEAWRRQHIGRFTISYNKGEDITEFYNYLHDTYGSMFPADIGTGTDQLLYIADFVDNFVPESQNPYSYDMAGATQAAALDILNSITEAPVAEPTLADVEAGKAIDRMNKKADQRVQNAKDAAKRRSDKRMERMREENRQRMDALRNRARESKEHQLQKLKDHYKEVAENRKARQEESTARRKLLKLAQRLDRMKTTKANKALINELIGDLDKVAMSLTSGKAESLEELNEWYTNQKENNPDFVAHQGLVEKQLSRLNQRHIKDMTLDEVRELTDALRTIENDIRTQNQLLASEDKRDTFEMGLDIIRDIDNAKGIGKGIRRNFDNVFVTGTLSPTRFIHRLTGYVDSNPLYRAVAGEEGLAGGQRKMLDYQYKAGKLFEKWVSDREFTKKITGKKAEILTYNIVTADGKQETIQMTPAMRMELYLASKDQGWLRHMCGFDTPKGHLAGGGITLPDIKSYRKGNLSDAYDSGTKTVKITKSFLNQLANDMSAQEKAFADAIHDYFNGMSKDSINAVSELLLGRSIAEVGDYLPISVDKNFLGAEYGAIKYDGTIEGMGNLKERVNSAKPVIVRDITDVLRQSIESTSKYVGLAIPIRNFNKLMGVTVGHFDADGTYQNFEGSVLQSIANKWGGKAQRYIEKMISDLQTPNNSQEDLEKAFSKIRSKYAGAVLTLNLSVAMKQAASYPTAAAVLGWKPLMQAFKNPGHVDLDFIAKWTPLQWYRTKGFSTTELGDIQNQNNFFANMPKGLNWIQGVDLITTRKLWKASEYYVRDNQPELYRKGAGERGQSEAFYRAVADIYNQMIEETQPNYTALQRPELLRSKSGLVQTLMMFKTQPFQNFNILYDAIGDFRGKRAQYINDSNNAEIQEQYKKAGKKLRLAITSQVGQLITFAAMTMAWNLFRRKKEKYTDEEGNFSLEVMAENMGKDIGSGVFGMVPFGPELWSMISSMAFGDTYYGFESVTDSALGDLGEAVMKAWNTIGDMITSDEPFDFTAQKKNLRQIASAISKAFGMPLDNIYNLITAGYKRYNDIFEDPYYADYASIAWDDDPSKKKKDISEILYQAFKNGDMEDYMDLRDVLIDSGEWGTDEKSPEADIDDNVQKRFIEEVSGGTSKQGAYDYLATLEGDEYDTTYQQMLDLGFSADAISKGVTTHKIGEITGTSGDSSEVYAALLSQYEADTKEFISWIQQMIEAGTAEESIQSGLKKSYGASVTGMGYSEVTAADVYNYLYELFKTKSTEYREAYQTMIDVGFTESAIKTGMEGIMKQEQGVDNAKDLKSRYEAPTHTTPSWWSTKEEKEAAKEQAKKNSNYVSYNDRKQKQEEEEAKKINETVSVNSSWIASIGYDENTQTLTMTTKGGRTYTRTGVSPETYTEFKNSDAGRYWNSHFK